MKPGLDGSQVHRFGSHGEAALGAILFFSSSPSSWSCVLCYAATCNGALVNVNVDIRWAVCAVNRRCCPRESIALMGLPSPPPSPRLNLRLPPVTVGKRCQGSAQRGEGGGRKHLLFAGQGAHYILGTWNHAHPTCPSWTSSQPWLSRSTAPGRHLNLCSAMRTVHACGMSQGGWTFAPI